MNALLPIVTTLAAVALGWALCCACFALQARRTERWLRDNEIELAALIKAHDEAVALANEDRKPMPAAWTPQDVADLELLAVDDEAIWRAVE